MDIDGFYRITYQSGGIASHGVFLFQAGVVVGVSAAGTHFDGTYRLNGANGRVEVDMTNEVPAGGAIAVASGRHVPAGSRLAIRFAFAPSGEEIGPILVRTSEGPVNILISKLRDLPG